MSPAHQTPTQVSFGNFPDDVQARELTDFLEARVGLVLRCKIKKAPAIFPPHAFVHFESPKVAQEAKNKADKGRLIFRREWPLKACMDDRGFSIGRRGLNSKVHSYIELTDVKVEVGSIVGPESMLISWRGPEKGSFFRIEPAGKRLRFFFSLDLHVSPESQKTRCEVLMEVRLHEVKEVREVEREVDPVLLLQLSSPPSIFYRTAEDDVYEWEWDPSQLADDEDPWIRSLDIVTPDRSIGRCLDYRLTVSPRQKTAFTKAITYFRNHNVLKKSVQKAYALKVERPPNSNDAHFFTVPHQKEISFDAMILVNALVHRGILHVSNLSSTFYNLLTPDGRTPAEVVIFCLKQLLTYKSPVFKPAEELQSVIQKVMDDMTLVTETELTAETMVVRRLIITPTRAVCLPPEVELSNRVLRRFRVISDRFLRVSFLDEDGLSLSSGSLMFQIPQIVRTVSSNVSRSRTDVYTRIVCIMKNGFRLCGREYHFLAFSNGQLRDSSAWFYATDGHIKVNQIREWMGTFPGKNVAKHAARMGQCFSATYSTTKVQDIEVFELADVKRNGYDFSDGCGMISPEFAQVVAEVLKLSENPPSVYQIRYGGYKGVVAVWPIERSSGKMYKLALRSSMKKFDSCHRDLEICSWSRFMPSYLNRQIITLLSTLNVDDKVFEELQETMIQNLNRMVVDRALAYSVLRVSCAGELYNSALRMLCAGFDPSSEAYLKSMLVAIRAGQLEELAQKSKIFVSKGRLLMGCLDETATLEYGECFVQVTSPEDRSKSVVITGPMIMTKNPCLHVGDIRVLTAVDVPALYHMKDCLVVPQNGPRPHPNEVSGSDLDGDLYFVFWDERLLPPSRESWVPMEYEAEVARDLRGPVRIEQVVEFFVKHMINDNLGKITNAHVVQADISPKGALDKNCLRLADLAAKAVDYPKTGKPAVMPFELKPQKYPDFLQKDESITYESSKIIGRLFRSVQGILPKERAMLQMENVSGDYRIPEPKYDSDLEVAGFEAHLEKAWALKQSYDRQLHAIMTQFSITNEAEVVTGHVILGAKKNSRRQGDVKERVAYAYTALHKEYSRLINPHTLGHSDQDSDGVRIDPEEDLSAQVSAWYCVTYHQHWYQKAQDINPGQRPFLSFPWVAVDQLIAIKNRKRTGI
ncbi:unnamed protein product [Calypogeia fissa]